MKMDLVLNELIGLDFYFLIYSFLQDPVCHWVLSIQLKKCFLNLHSVLIPKTTKLIFSSLFQEPSNQSIILIYPWLYSQNYVYFRLLTSLFPIESQVNRKNLSSLACSDYFISHFQIHLVRLFPFILCYSHKTTQFW